MDLIAIKSLKHASMSYEPGDVFTAKDRDGRILVAIGKAKLAEVVKAKPVSRQFVAQKQSDEGFGKRSYQRRDLTAEQSDD